MKQSVTVWEVYYLAHDGIKYDHIAAGTKAEAARFIMARPNALEILSAKRVTLFA